MSKTQSKMHKKKILEGKFLSIDPSSGAIGADGKASEAGWAVFENGRLTTSGTIDINESGAKQNRLRNLLEIIQREFTDEYDLLVLELIKGWRAQQSLIQSTGVVIAGINSEATFEINVTSWQAIARRLGTWEKSDEGDAVHIGAAAIAWALDYDLKKHKGKTLEDMETILSEVRTRI